MLQCETQFALSVGKETGPRMHRSHPDLILRVPVADQCKEAASKGRFPLTIHRLNRVHRAEVHAVLQTLLHRQEYDIEVLV